MSLTNRDLAAAVAKLAPAMTAAVEELDELLHAALAAGRCSLTPPVGDEPWRGAVVYVGRDNGHWLCEVHFPDAGRLTFADDDPVPTPGR